MLLHLRDAAKFRKEVPGEFTFAGQPSHTDTTLQTYRSGDESDVSSSSCGR